MAQFRFMLWLALWYQKTEAFEFDWDQGNCSKSSRKHSVGIDEIESVFALRLAVALGRQVAPEVPEERFCLVGPSRLSRMLSVVFTIRKGRVRVVSGRPASRKERKLYEEVREALEKL